VRNQLLRDSDVMAMASGVELRTPFLDARVVDTLSRVPASSRLEAGKGLLRRAIPELPPWVGSQGKRCFQFPFAQWNVGEWRDHFKGVDRDCPAPTSTWYRQWCVAVLRSWMSNTRTALHE
jgi:asparagine synthase (glutamine-hydrolysing)